MLLRHLVLSGLPQQQSGHFPTLGPPSPFPLHLPSSDLSASALSLVKEVYQRQYIRPAQVFPPLRPSVHHWGRSQQARHLQRAATPTCPRPCLSPICTIIRSPPSPMHHSARITPRPSQASSSPHRQFRPAHTRGCLDSTTRIRPFVIAGEVNHMQKASLGQGNYFIRR